jgi:hypothetical protein
MRRAILLSLCACAMVAAQAPAPPSAVETLRQQFRDPPADSRPMMRWWWFGPAVTAEGIDRELRIMRDGGIGGVEVQPVYPLSLDDESRGIRNLAYLSPEFLSALRATAARSKELGLRFDLTLGSGWPYGGPQVPVHEAAARIRVDRVAVAAGTRRVGLPTLGAGEAIVAAFVRAGADGAASDVPFDSAREGALWLPESRDAAREVLFFVATRTGQMVKRAAFGAEGYVLDHLDRTALDHYLARVGAPQLSGPGADVPYAIFCDSLEAYGNDWTGDFLQQFRQRRGYDLKPHLPALVDERHQDAGGVRHDWALTLSELLDERFFAPLGAWAREKGTRLRIQGYGSPPAMLWSNRHADLVDGEGSHWRELTASRWAASASHVLGKPVVASETWTWLHSPVFRATPLDLKAEADRHFLQGINQLIGHGWPYTPEGVDYPGWRFYAAGVFNEKNPWWIVMPDLSRYLQRVSFVLRQGRPVSDVAIYLPTHDALAKLTPGQVNLMPALVRQLGATVIDQVLSAGFTFDFVDDGTIVDGSRADGGALVVGDGRYRVVVIPHVEAMPAATAQKLETLAKAGVAVIATGQAPRRVPGLRPSEREQHSMQAAVTELFAATGAAGRIVEDEKTLGAAIARAIAPDVTFEPPAPEVGFVHRRAGDAEIYFLANTSPVRRSGTVTVRATGLDPEWWDPLAGEVLAAITTTRSAATSTMPFELEPYGSRVLVLAPGHRKTASASNVPARAASRTLVDLNADWDVRFGDAAEAVHMTTLRSWIDEEQTRYFSGVATYERRFVVPSAGRSRTARLVLDLGDGAVNDEPQPSRNTPGMSVPFDAPVREAAVIEVNGRRAGAIWCPPYRLDVTSLVRAGENTIRIRVGNLAINHMAGRPAPDYRLLNLRYGERFQAQDMDKVRPLPSGLLGPVRLLATDEGGSR